MTTTDPHDPEMAPDRATNTTANLRSIVAMTAVALVIVVVSAPEPSVAVEGRPTGAIVELIATGELHQAAVPEPKWRATDPWEADECPFGTRPDFAH